MLYRTYNADGSDPWLLVAVDRLQRAHTKNVCSYKPLSEHGFHSTRNVFGGRFHFTHLFEAIRIVVSFISELLSTHLHTGYTTLATF